MLDVQASLTARSPDSPGCHGEIGVPGGGSVSPRVPLQTRAGTGRRQTAPRAVHFEQTSAQCDAAERASSLSFVQAVEAMKAGQAVRRACGRRLYVFIAQQEERFSDALGCTVFIGPEDVLATDWEIAGEAMRRR